MNYARWIAMSDDELSADGIAAVNLACASGLPGTETLDTSECLRKLNHWVELIRYSTEQLLPKFQREPERYENSEGCFRMLVAVTVLQRNLGVRYDPSCMDAYSFATRIVPNSPSNRGHWAVATMMFRITEELERAGLRDCWQFPPAEFQRILVSHNPPECEPWERWARPRAKERLERIYNIHHQRIVAVRMSDKRTQARSAVFSNMVTTSSDQFS